MNYSYIYKQEVSGISMAKRKRVRDVFTPRRSEVNELMYVDRPNLEEILFESLDSEIHTFLFGESGNGKSWLYKKVFADHETEYIVINSGSIRSSESITTEILNSLIQPGTARKVAYDEDKGVSLDGVIAKGGIKHSGKYKVHQKSPLLEAFQEFFKLSKQKKIIVIENMELMCQSNQLMSELADIIILLDDSNFSKYNINFLLVGLPSGAMEYYRTTENLESISNRIEEIPKVEGLNSNEVLKLIESGFELLKIEITGAEILELAMYVKSITLGIAQRVHEYCSCLSKEIESNQWNYKRHLIAQADERWLNMRLRQSYQVLTAHLPKSPDKDQFRYEVVYCISKIEIHEFTSYSIAEVYDVQFPPAIELEFESEIEAVEESEAAEENDTEAKHELDGGNVVGIELILQSLSQSNKPLLKKIEDSDNYSIRDPRYIMCLKLMITKNSDTGEIVKRAFSI